MARLALLVHLLAVVFWVGGMAFVHLALRPALAEVPEPPRRLTLLVAVLSRFLAGVSVAVVLILASGAYLLAAVGPDVAPAAVHAMTAIGIVMALVFAYIRLRSYPVLRSAVAAQTWPAAGAAAATIRRLVALNLVLGTIVIALVTLGR